MAKRSKKEEFFYVDIGKRIRLLRNKKQLTQEQLAERANLKRTSITNIEKGCQNTPLFVVANICYVLEVEISDLVPSVVEIFGSRVSNIDYVQVGESRKFMSKSMADVVTKIGKTL